MRVGIDFDNTLIDYDRVFVNAARERGLVRADFVGPKRALRDAIRELPDGEIAWQQLQGYVYSVGIRNAAPFSGAGEFVRICADREIPLFVISHKTRYGHFDPARIDLRAAAFDWLAAQGFLEPNFGIDRSRVYFEDDRTAKLARIGSLQCTHFIDDLEEVFSDPDFPQGVQRILFGSAAESVCDVHCKNWGEVKSAVFPGGA